MACCRRERHPVADSGRRRGMDRLRCGDNDRYETTRLTADMARRRMPGVADVEVIFRLAQARHEIRCEVVPELAGQAGIHRAAGRDVRCQPV